MTSAPRQWKPRVAVLGLGSYYGKLRQHLFEELSPTVLLDTPEFQVEKLDDTERARFRCYREANDLDALVREVDGCLVLSSNRTHADLSLALLRRGIPTVVEKPVAVTHSQLDELSRAVDPAAPLYVSDFYVDVRSIPLLALAGKLHALPWRKSVLVDEGKAAEGGESSLEERLGQILEIRGRILEPYSMRDSPSSGEAQSGGVLFDMMVHLLALTRELFPLEELVVESVRKGWWQSSKEPGEYEWNPPGAGAEAYARLKGRLGEKGIPVDFEVAKHSKEMERYFLVVGSKGAIQQHYCEGHPCSLDLMGIESKVLKVAGDRYALAVRGFREWLSGNRRCHGWQEAVWAVRRILEMRVWEPPVGAVSPTLGIRKSDSTQHREEAPRAGHFTRGHFLKILGGVLMGAAGSATWDAVKWSSGIITKSAGKECEQYLRQHTAVSQERIAALADALFPVRKGSVDAAAPTRLLLSPGTEHRDLSASGVRLRQGWYPHDFRVLSAMSVFLGFSPTFIAANDLPAWVRGREVVLGTGSTTSSSIARALAGDPRLSYSYRLEELEERSVRVYSAALGREELKRLKRLVSILDGEELYHDRAHVDDQGWLKKDILLVTVAPHLDGGFDVVQLSGGHGAGTEAAKLMLDPEAFPDEDFWSFVRAVQEVRYFQAVLEVEDVERQGPDGATVGHGLRLSQLAPPRAVIRLPDLV